MNDDDEIGSAALRRRTYWIDSIAIMSAWLSLNVIYVLTHSPWPIAPLLLTAFSVGSSLRWLRDRLTSGIEGSTRE